jgi:hypothetical protein
MLAGFIAISDPSVSPGTTRDVVSYTRQDAEKDFQFAVDQNYYMVCSQAPTETGIYE